jgi:hypothetical protein
VSQVGRERETRLRLPTDHSEIADAIRPLTLNVRGIVTTPVQEALAGEITPKKVLL